MDVIFLVGGLYFIARGFGAFNRRDDSSWRSFRGDYAIEDGCAGCMWWVIALPLILVALA